MTWVATAVIGSAVVGAWASVEAADSAADATADASDASIAEQRRQFDLYRQDQSPYREVGKEALFRLNWMARGNPGAFQVSPGYKFRQQEGEKALNRSLAARGMALSGAGVKEGMRYNQGLASEEFGNYWNRQAGLAGVGQTSVQSTGAAGMQTAANIGNYLTNAGNARTNAYLTQGQGINNAIQGGIGNYLTYANLGRTPPPPSPYTGGGSLYQDGSGLVYNLPY